MGAQEGLPVLLSAGALRRRITVGRQVFLRLLAEGECSLEDLWAGADQGEVLGLETCAWAGSAINAHRPTAANDSQLVQHETGEALACRRLELGTGGVAVILDGGQEMLDLGIAVAALLSRTSLQIHVPKAEITGILEILDLRARTDDILRRGSDKSL